MASKLPQKKGANLSFDEHCNTRGSWLACDASDAIYRLNPVDAIASKPAPTKKGQPSVLMNTAIPVGAGLLAMQATRSTG